MHPYVKQHKLLRLVPLVLILLIMIASPASSRNCNGKVRSMNLFSEMSRGYVRIEGKKIVATENFSENSNQAQAIHTIQTIPIMNTIDFVIYHPSSSMFICWNQNFTNLVARRNPKHLRYCIFREKVSQNANETNTRYTTTTFSRRHRKRVEVELRFNRRGQFPKPSFIERCLKKRRKSVGGSLNVASIVGNLNNIPAIAKSSDYKELTKCASADIIPKPADKAPPCDTASINFCKQMAEIQKRHGIAPELEKFCCSQEETIFNGCPKR